MRGLGRGPGPRTTQCCIPPPGSRLRPRLPSLRKTNPLNTDTSPELPLTCPLPPSSLKGKNTEGEGAHSSPPICSDFQHCNFVEASGQHQPSSLAFETGHSPLSGWYCVFLPSAPGSGWGLPHAFPSVTAQLAAPGETLTPPHHCSAAPGGTATRREKTRAVRCPRPGGPHAQPALSTGPTHALESGEEISKGRSAGHVSSVLTCKAVLRFSRPPKSRLRS